MELTDYTTEELKAELKKRTAIERKEKEEKMKTASRCRNCIHCIPNVHYNRFYNCEARTYGKNYPRHYVVKLSNKACEKFERK